MTELTNLTIAQARDGLAKKSFTATELTEAHIAQATNTQSLNSYIVETFDHARNQAAASDKRIQENNAGKMEGIPVGVKDLFCTKGFRSTSCSHILDGFTPPYESTVTTNLFQQGAVMIGKTNMDEFAMGSTNANSYYGPAINPWKDNSGKDLTPGGSSGGSAAAVAAKSCMGALGSDTGGSIRQPAAFTGTVGIKPTYGRCSRWGMIAFASSLDQAGVFTRTVQDAAIMLEAICGYDTKDSTSANVATPHFESAITGNIKGLRIGIPKEYHAEGTSRDIEKLWEQGKEWLQSQGAEIVDISLPHTHYALPTYYIIAPAEASANLARYDGVRYGLRVCEEGDSLDNMYAKTRAAGFGNEVKRRIMIGTYVLSSGYYDAYYTKAQKVRTLIIQDFNQAFEKVDAILTPTTPTPAFGVNDTLDPVSMYLNDVFTVPASLAGLPGISIPTGLSENGLPLGLQLISKAFDEETLFRVAGALEQAANFTHQPQGV